MAQFSLLSDFFAVKQAIASRFEGKDKVIAINHKALDLGLSL